MRDSLLLVFLCRPSELFSPSSWVIRLHWRVPPWPSRTKIRNPRGMRANAQTGLPSHSRTRPHVRTRTPATTASSSPRDGGCVAGMVYCMIRFHTIHHTIEELWYLPVDVTEFSAGLCVCSFTTASLHLHRLPYHVILDNRKGNQEVACISLLILSTKCLAGDDPFTRVVAEWRWIVISTVIVCEHEWGIILRVPWLLNIIHLKGATDKPWINPERIGIIKALDGKILSRSDHDDIAILQGNGRLTVIRVGIYQLVSCDSKAFRTAFTAVKSSHGGHRCWRWYRRGPTIFDCSHPISLTIGLTSDTPGFGVCRKGRRDVIPALIIGKGERDVVVYC